VLNSWYDQGLFSDPILTHPEDFVIPITVLQKFPPTKCETRSKKRVRHVQEGEKNDAEFERFKKELIESDFDEGGAYYGIVTALSNRIVWKRG
jgi:hypothetical protein